MRFFRRGKSKISFLPAVAATTVVNGATVPGDPTRAEITAGTPLSASVAEVSGFQLSNSPIATPNLADTFTPQIDGEDTVADSSLTFYDDDTATTIRTSQAKGTAGFMLLMPYGDTPTKRCEVWPVKSTGVNDEWSVGNDPARFAVGYAVTGTPNQAAVVPAAV
jgi:hypothetical protein